MRKYDEIALYAYMRDAAARPDERIASTREAAEALGIPGKRAHYLVEKWRGQFCDGVSTNYVYFYTNAPTALLVWGEVR